MNEKDHPNTEQQMGEDLQALLDQNPQMDPTPMLDDGRLVILSIIDGIPHVTNSPAPTFDCKLPDAGSQAGSAASRIYQLLKGLTMHEEETQVLSDAAMQIQTAPPPPIRGIRIEPPTTPSTPEIVLSAASGNMSLQLQEDKNGMYRNLESLQASLREQLAKNSELSPIVIRTTRENFEVSAAGGQLHICPSEAEGQPYLAVRTTPQARLLQIARTIQGLEEKLYGSNVSIRVAKPPVKLTAAQNLAQMLDEIDGGNIAIYIRSRRTMLYLSSTDKMITYRGVQTSLERGQLVDENTTEEPSGYTKVEYGALPKPVTSVLQAYWAYISPKSAKQES
jgi:hypothetical protein